MTPKVINIAEEEDPDPLYEIYSCHRVTFIENKLKNKENFERVNFTKNDDFVVSNKMPD